MGAGGPALLPAARRHGGVLKKRVLVVCHANTARSVMAQKLIERMLSERGLADALHVSSAGVWSYARDGMIPSLDARLALKEVGIFLAEDGMASTLNEGLRRIVQ